ncbi:hypothetical protein [Vibrio atypicus]|uniref:hypothetical protein n=1 Tax=Vibrio atypicus TaxID=558271 RepID=UPI001358495D|nr:hypothetical protein [Vibrio atypicus]
MNNLLDVILFALALPGTAMGNVSLPRCHLVINNYNSFTFNKFIFIHLKFYRAQTFAKVPRNYSHSPFSKDKKSSTLCAAKSMNPEGPEQFREKRSRLKRSRN